MDAAVSTPSEPLRFEESVPVTWRGPDGHPGAAAVGGASRPMPASQVRAAPPGRSCPGPGASGPRSHARDNPVVRGPRWAPGLVGPCQRLSPGSNRNRGADLYKCRKNSSDERMDHLSLNTTLLRHYQRVPTPVPILRRPIQTLLSRAPKFRDGQEIPWIQEY